MAGLHGFGSIIPSENKDEVWLVEDIGSKYYRRTEWRCRYYVYIKEDTLFNIYTFSIRALFP